MSCRVGHLSVVALLLVLLTLFDASSAHRRRKRIIHGDVVLEGEHPWACSLMIKFVNASTQEESSFLCGGTLISPSVVLTAAHCIYHAQDTAYASKVTVTVNDFTLNEVDAYEHVQTTSDFELSREYIQTGEVAVFDYALVYLPRSVPVCEDRWGPRVALLPFDMTHGAERLDDGRITDSNCYTIGWGVTEGGSPAVQLQKMAVREMRTAMHNTSQSRFFYARLTGHSRACFGDSGGPLLCRTPHNHDYLVGVNSEISNPESSSAPPHARRPTDGVTGICRWANTLLVNDLRESLRLASRLLSARGLLDEVEQAQMKCYPELLEQHKHYSHAAAAAHSPV